MEFRPCIDIHDGKIKQIVGGSILEKDGISKPEENFVSNQDGSFFAKFYKQQGIRGGHVILLNKPGTDEYEQTKKQALSALLAYPGGLQIGGGINASNALEFIEKGASHVIVTSYVFSDGVINYDNLDRLVQAVGNKHLVLDLSVRKKEDGRYYIVTDRWQKFTDTVLTKELLIELEKYCDEYLIHAVDVEGKQNGVDETLVKLLYSYKANENTNQITYAGGIHSYDDVEIIRSIGDNRINLTVGSALDLFGGKLEFSKIVAMCQDF